MLTLAFVMMLARADADTYGGLVTHVSTFAASSLLDHCWWPDTPPLLLNQGSDHIDRETFPYTIKEKVKMQYRYNPQF